MQTAWAPAPTAADEKTPPAAETESPPRDPQTRTESGNPPPAAPASNSEDQLAQADGVAPGAPEATPPKADEAKANDPAPEDEAAPPEDGNPFVHKIPAPEFPKDMEWLNTSGPIRLSDLRGKFVLFDFWTYCCINCMHILPELKKLEKAYPNELVVIGVHSAKFETEQDSENIKEAILRYEIEHPVVNDSQHQIWDSYGVRSWPTILLIDPEGNAVFGKSGEFKFEQLDPLMKQAVAYYREKGKLDPTPVRFDLLAHRQEETPLRFPGKVLADEASNRLFIADSNHNRIVVADLEGKLLDVIGSGAVGANDGDYQQATFNHPQGMAVDGDTLYVADTENHLIRKVDLKEEKVFTIAGLGQQARSGWPGLEKLGPYDQPPERWVGEPSKTAISSPWALWVHKTDLYIAMAGPHQIWKMTLDGKEIGPYAGNGREDIVDGPLLPRLPYEEGYASFAQPSGLTSDGEFLYVADSEGSSIRAVPFDPTQEVKTLVGTAHLPFGRLFEFGDVDGQGEAVRLQHPLGVAFHDGKVYIADTYNDKVKELDLAMKTVKSIAGGRADDESVFDEPAGLSYAAGKLYVADTNNHRIRTVDLNNGNQVASLEIQGLTPPEPVEKPKAPAFAGTPRTEVPSTMVQPHDGKISLQVKIELPQGWKINILAPNGYRVDPDDASGPVDRAALGKMVRLKEPSATFTIELPVIGEGRDSLDVGVAYYYCQEGGEGLCKVGSAAWTVPVEVSAAAKESVVELSHQVEE
jgi:thiol-disulfide isomerase/thioredoxin